MLTQIQFAKRLSVLITAGIAVPDSLRLVKIVDCGRFSDRVSSGQSFSFALDATFKVDKLLLVMAYTGERSGSLAKGLHQAASILQSNSDRKKKITSAFVYPSFIATATIGITGFLVVYIFPKITPLLLSMNVPLPLLTRVVMSTSNLFINHWMGIVISLIVTYICGFYMWVRFNFLKKYWFILIFSTPFIAPIFRGSTWITFLYSIGALLEYGESLPMALSFAGGISKYGFYSDLFNEASCYVKNGGSLSQYLEEKTRVYPKYVPDVIPDIFFVGEKTAGIKESCEQLADIFKSEVEDSIGRLSQSIEPILMICMGLLVGSIALSIVLPLYEITNHLAK